jgi:hypothetical protein
MLGLSLAPPLGVRGAGGGTGHVGWLLGGVSGGYGVGPAGWLADRPPRAWLGPVRLIAGVV